MSYSYSLLEKIFDTYKDLPHELSTTYLLCCQHLLEPQMHMFEKLIAFGFKPENIIVLGKVYSANKEIVGELKDRGITVVLPEFLGGSFDEEHRNNCNQLVNNIPQNTENIIILDDGGEIIKICIEQQRKILFAVEQTSSGFRKLENIPINFPIINVARSQIKLVQESPFVAQIAFERITPYISQNNIVNPLVFVVGLGPIGESMVKICEQNGIKVQGFDIKHGHKDLIAAINIQQPNIIIGATGVQILSKEEIDQISVSHQLFLCSVSSSDREFPVVSFRKDTKIHEDVFYKNIIFVNNGFPITFKGNRYEIEPQNIEKTICLLSGSIVFGVTHPNELISGLIEVPKQLEEIITS